ncbi:hypothetical protein [Tunturiibacter gelidoferens]|jgi:hypothetical protein|uniref:Uncharacterized protein n=1 Tax=Tunturiibacter gelidiferens TaxID=3069689 RepID=A0A9X0QHI0_9BACT|nr:hypothetical protein [Edaphobacter lichenicola]MBB5330455.1 hypothetical protein [Edaphobacter lichenicola]
MARPRLHKTLLTLSLGFPFVAFTIAAHSQTQALPHDTAIGRLEIFATFNGPMPTGVTVSRANRVFVNFPRWGDDVPFTHSANRKLVGEQHGANQSIYNQRNSETDNEIYVTKAPFS